MSQVCSSHPGGCLQHQQWLNASTEATGFHTQVLACKCEYLSSYQVHALGREPDHLSGSERQMHLFCAQGHMPDQHVRYSKLEVFTAFMQASMPAITNAHLFCNRC